VLTSIELTSLPFNRIYPLNLLILIQYNFTNGHRHMSTYRNTCLGKFIGYVFFPSFYSYSPHAFSSSKKKIFCKKGDNKDIH
jgi:hypothetical protein